MVVVLIVDKVGRKPLLIFGGMIMGVSMLALGSLFHSRTRGVRPRGHVPVSGRLRDVASAPSCGS